MNIHSIFVALCATAAIASASLCWAPLACAQDGSASSNAPPASSAGILAGPILLQPELFVEASYDSNVFSQNIGELPAGKTLTSSWLIVPGFLLKASTPDPKDTSLSASARLSSDLYLSSDDSLLAQSGIDFTSNAALTLNRLGLIAWKPSLSYNRTNSPQYTANNDSYNEHILNLGLDMIIQPEGGHVFNSTLGYNVRAYFLEQFSDFNRQTHSLLSHTRWSFLFQTALLLNIDWQLVNYSTSQPSPQNANLDPTAIYTLSNVGSAPIRISSGISSLLFGRLDFRLLGGYAYTFYDSGPNDHLLLLHASVGYQWPDESKTRIGYVKDFSDTTFGNYLTFHRIFAQWEKGFFDKRLNTSLQTNIDIRSYSGVANTPQRDETFVSLTSSFDWRFIDSFKAGLRYQLTLNSTDFGVVIPTAAGSIITLADYSKHVIFLNAVYMF